MTSCWHVNYKKKNPPVYGRTQEGLRNDQFVMFILFQTVFTLAAIYILATIFC